MKALIRRYGRSGRRYGMADPSSSGLRYEVEKTHNGWTVVAYSPGGTRMPLATYPTRTAAVRGIVSNRKAMESSQG